MRVKIILHGQLARGELQAEVSSAREAIEALGTQLKPFQHLGHGKRPAVRVVGFPTRESIDGPLPEGTTEIHLIPAMLGGGGKFASFIVAGILIIVGVLLLPTNPVLGTALIVSGITMAVAGVVQLFFPAPKAKPGVADPEASKYFGANANTIRIGTPIPLAYGRVTRFGHILSLNVNAQDLLRGSFPASP